MSAVWIGGEVVCENGRFTRIDRDAVLERIARELARPRSPEETHRRWLRAQVFPVMKDFYRDYLDGETPRRPFYGTSSRD